MILHGKFLPVCVLFFDKIMKDRICAEKREEVAEEARHDQSSSSKPLKTKTTKAERRALQEAQRAAKAASKGSSLEFSILHIKVLTIQLYVLM